MSSKKIVKKIPPKKYLIILATRSENIEAILISESVDILPRWQVALKGGALYI